MDDYIQFFGLLSVPVGILLMCFAALWQMHVMFTGTEELDRYEGKELAKVVAWLFFTFSLAVYKFCPKSRKKGVVFALTMGLGLFLYFFSTMYIFKVLYPPKPAPVADEDGRARVEAPVDEPNASKRAPRLKAPDAGEGGAQAQVRSQVQAQAAIEAGSDAGSEAASVDSLDDSKQASDEPEEGAPAKAGTAGEGSGSGAIDSDSDSESESKSKSKSEPARDESAGKTASSPEPGQEGGAAP